MNTSKHASLGEQISKKMSVWILILTSVITTGIFTVSYLLSKQTFNQQVRIWNSIAPQNALSSLIDSDHFSIKREIKFLESTGLFSSFVITDNQKRVISQFGEKQIDNSALIPIQDEGKIIWGYYEFTPNFNKYFSPFLIAGIIFASLVLLLYFFIRWRVKSALDVEFTKFNQFLNEIELLTEKLNEIYNEDENNFSVNIKSSHSIEQVIINRAISKLLNEIKASNKSLREAILKSEQKRFEEELTKTALQVTHDIGSPLAVLETIVQSNSFSLPEESRISLRNASSRIRDIANSLLKKAKRNLLSINEGLLVQQNLYSLINQVVTEKRLQFFTKKNIQINFDFDLSSYGMFALIKVGDFSRVLSNIINNSVDAIDGMGEIIITLSNVNNYAVITIEDNGKGMSNELLLKLGTLGTTYGKSKGLGLGVYHAKNTIESWSGIFEVQSALNQGTTVKIHLPLAQHPSWFVPELRMTNKQDVIIIDDDESIHDVWKTRFNDLKNKSNIELMVYHFYSPEEFLAWKNSHTESPNYVVYLCDYEFLGSDENGIDLILKFKINYLSILVTSRFNADEITSQCEASGIKLLPKEMASIIPISC